MHLHFIILRKVLHKVMEVLCEFENRYLFSRNFSSGLCLNLFYKLNFCLTSFSCNYSIIKEIIEEFILTPFMLVKFLLFSWNIVEVHLRLRR
jgi:hypothetical protein